MEPARPNCHGLLVQRRQALAGSVSSLSGPSPSTHSPIPNGPEVITPRRLHHHVRSKRAGVLVSPAWEKQKKGQPASGPYSPLEPWTPVILHLGPGLCSRRLRIYGLTWPSRGLDDLACFACMTPDSLSAVCVGPPCRSYIQRTRRLRAAGHQPCPRCSSPPPEVIFSIYPSSAFFDFYLPPPPPNSLNIHRKCDHEAGQYPCFLVQPYG